PNRDDAMQVSKKSSAAEVISPAFVSGGGFQNTTEGQFRILELQSEYEAAPLPVPLLGHRGWRLRNCDHERTLITESCAGRASPKEAAPNATATNSTYASYRHLPQEQVA